MVLCIIIAVPDLSYQFWIVGNDWCKDSPELNCWRYVDAKCLAFYEDWARAHCPYRCGYCPSKYALGHKAVLKFLFVGYLNNGFRIILVPIADIGRGNCIIFPIILIEKFSFYVTDLIQNKLFYVGERYRLKVNQKW